MPTTSVDPFGLEEIHRVDGVTFHAYPKPAPGTNRGEHARHGPGGEYHAHINGDPNKRWDVYNNRPLTEADAKNFTKKELQVCENLSNDEKRYLKRATREIFHRNRSGAIKAWEALRRSQNAVRGLSALTAYAASNTHMEACAKDIEGEVPFCD